jgi:hypothetical protein
MSRSILLAAVVAPLLVACGGPKYPMHSGYHKNNKTPWTHAKVIQLDARLEGKTEGTLDYRDYKRAAWYAVRLPGDGDLGVNLEVFPPGDDKFDLAMEVLSPSFQVISKSDQSSQDAFDVKKSKSLIELKRGVYLVHVYLENRLDQCDFDLGIKFTPRKLAGEDTFPQQVAFVPDLPVVPIQDDTPITKPTHHGHHGHHTGGHSPPPPPPPPPGGLPVAGRVINVQVAGNATQIIFNKGIADGLHDGAKGQVSGIKNGAFEAFGCGQRTCKGRVKATIDEVNRSGKVVVQP